MQAITPAGFFCANNLIGNIAVKFNLSLLSRDFFLRCRQILFRVRNIQKLQAHLDVLRGI